MDLTLLVARLVLAATFAIAGVAKLRDTRGTAQTLIAFRVPVALVAPLARGLPLMELSVAAFLVVPSLGWVGALGALTLVSLFSAAVAVNLAQGRRPTCSCFGRLGEGPIGAKTLVRNGALALLSAVILVGNNSAMGDPAAFVEALAMASTILVPMAAVVRRRPKAPRSDFAGSDVSPPPSPSSDRPFPELALPGLTGGTVHLADLGGPRDLLLLAFTNPACRYCDALPPLLAAWQRAYAEQLTVAVISTGPAATTWAKLAPHGIQHVVLDRDRTSFTAFDVTGTPSVVIVDLTGRAVSEVAFGIPAIRDLVEHSLSGRTPVAA